MKRIILMLILAVVGSSRFASAQVMHHRGPVIDVDKANAAIDVANLAIRCTSGPRRYRLMDTNIADLQPIANYYSSLVQLDIDNRAVQIERPLKEWLLITGHVIQITETNGMIVSAHNADNPESDSVPIRIKNFPFESVMVDKSGVSFFAVSDGRFRYLATDGAVSTIRSFDYGTYPTDKQIADYRASSDKANEAALLQRAREISGQNAEKNAQKKATQAKTFAFYLEKAKSSEASAQYRVGQLYLAGEGVEKNIPEGRKWLAAAAAQGNADAAKLLTASP
jgi:hypothetical protein